MAEVATYFVFVVNFSPFCQIKFNQGVQRRLVLVVNFSVVLKFNFFALLLLYLT